MLQTRDNYFQRTRILIEKLRSDNNKPVVLMGHSMGNLAIHYFLNWIRAQPHGTEWLDHYVHSHSFTAAAAAAAASALVLLLNCGCGRSPRGWPSARRISGHRRRSASW